MSDQTRTDLEQHFRYKRKHFETIFDAMDEGNELPEEYGSPDPSDALHESALETFTKRHIEILLTYGGPNIWLDAELDADGSVTSVTYESHWGGESFKRSVSPSDALYRVAEHFAEYLVEVGR